jgi:hypothetical protein
MDLACSQHSSFYHPMMNSHGKDNLIVIGTRSSMPDFISTTTITILTVYYPIVTTCMHLNL